ncbi:MAG: tyrosine-type recombinase/integrase, partial [Solirubrobacteraceae bacterium]
PAPAAVERLREWALSNAPHREQRLRQRDATIVSVLAYAGLRPQEALALSWGHVRERTLLIERATDFAGGLKSAKTRRARTVTLLAPLAGDLAEWRLASSRPSASALVFPAGSGQLWQRHDWQNWRNRTFIPAARSVGLDLTVPYDLRHAFCSLLLAEGRTFIEVAAQLGHAPSMTSDTYGHVIQELAGQRLPAEEQIRRARQALPIAAAGRLTPAG